MPFWLMKSEPDEFSIADLQRLTEARWDGVRNFQARNYLRAMNEGDSFLFYHSSCAIPGIAGIGRIIRTAYPDPTAADPTSPYHDQRTESGKNPWSAIDVGFVEAFQYVIPLTDLKRNTALTEMPLIRRGNRLSVMPVQEAEWAAILTMQSQT